ncbi:HPr family phosphocarrier protein [Brachyspira sp.]|uniref:HPr family phosphocarrier protein n=1 Tax=Brachyspira sp. TaxID=1977261 RepID=UPI002601CE6C|nr:HPr family phosphocarrier protein [Brachyspira sp.]
MTEVKYIINNISNIHARPLSELAKIAKDSNCEVSVKKGENVKDIKKIIGLIQLKLKVGDEVTVIIKGKDDIVENKARENIYNFFNMNF